ncbi:MAG: long-chain-acyl-CoA synthetase [Gammaproteobacteria bacterium]
MSQSLPVFEVPPREVTMARLMRGASRLAHFSRDMPYTVADRLEERARDAADRPFLLFEEQVISYAEANRRADRIGQAALRAGLQRGQVVALLMENRPEFVLFWLGLAKVGIVTALINTSARGAVLSHALAAVEARALVVGSELVEAVATLAECPLPVWEWAEPGIPSTGRFEDFAVLLAAAPTDPVPSSRRAGLVAADPLYLIFTSGTTGLPKAAKMSHLRFLNAGEMMGGLMGFGPQDVFYCVLPLYHGAGGMVVPSGALAFGIPFVLRRRFSTSGFWNDVRRHRITAVYYIGEIIRYLLNVPPAADDHDNTLRAMGGAGLRPDVWEAFVERFGVEQVIEGLGSTEANYGITNVDNRIGSVGRLPYPEYTNVRVLRYDVDAGEHLRTPEGQFLQATAGETGELVAEVLPGPGLAGFFEGYTSAAETERKLLRNVFRDDDVWFRSGDLVRFDTDGYYYFVDRVGDTYRWKSENVSTQEVETVLAQAPGIAVANVYGVRVPGHEGRAGMAAVTPTAGSTFDAARFHAHARAHLAPYAVPVFLRLTAAPEMTTTYKLVKTTLQRQGYSPATTGDDALYVADAAAGTYVPLTEAALARLGLAPFEESPHAP